MLTSDHALFAQWKLARVISSKDESFRKILGCPPDEVQIHDTGDGMLKIQFDVCLRIGMFRKRLLTKRQFGTEFVAAGRIWLLRMSSVAPDGFCRIHLSLSDESLPTRLDAVLVIEAHSGKPGCEIPPQGLRLRCYSEPVVLAPRWSPARKYTDLIIFTWTLKHWLMYENTMYADCNGTLHGKLKMTLK